MSTETDLKTDNQGKFTVEVEGEDPAPAVESPAPAPKAEKTAAPAIEVVDDTPEKDRNRGAPVPKELLTEVTEEELQGVSERVRLQLGRFTRGYHDERRAKEKEKREREAAEALARQLLAEKRALEQQLATGSQEYIANATALAETTLKNAQREYQEAFEANDGAKLAQAQAEIARAMMNLDRAKQLRPVQPPKNEVQTPQTRPVDPKLQAWKEANPWFGAKRAMTAYAVGLHDELAARGIVPGSDAYYEAIDNDVRRKFPEEFGTTDTDLPAAPVASPPPERPATRQPQKSPAVVASVPRGSASTPGVVRITKAQADVARRLGVPLEVYAAQVAMLSKENANG